MLDDRPSDALAILRCKMFQPKEYRAAREALEKQRVSSRRGSKHLTIFDPNREWSGSQILGR